MTTFSKKKKKHYLGLLGPFCPNSGNLGKMTLPSKKGSVSWYHAKKLISRRGKTFEHLN